MNGERDDLTVPGRDKPEGRQQARQDMARMRGWGCGAGLCAPLQQFASIPGGFPVRRCVVFVLVLKSNGGGGTREAGRRERKASPYD